jgi:hypothetical protein
MLFTKGKFAVLILAASISSATLQQQFSQFLGNGRYGKIVYERGVTCRVDTVKKYDGCADFQIWGVDSRDGTFRAITNSSQFPAGSGHLSTPALTSDGLRVVFSNWCANNVYLVNWDGTGLRQLESGYRCTDTWRGEGKDWAIIAKYTSNGFKAVYRMNIDNPAEKVLLYNGDVGGIYGTWETLSDDGTKMAGTFPWPYPGLWDVTNQKMIARSPQQGCWPGIFKPTGDRFFHIIQPHAEIVFVNLQGKVFKTVNFVQKVPGISYFQSPRWTNDTNIIVLHEYGNRVSGPYMINITDFSFVRITQPDTMIYNGTADMKILPNGAPETVGSKIVPMGNATISLNTTAAIPVYLGGLPCPTLSASGLPSGFSIQPAKSGTVYAITGQSAQNGVYRIKLTATNPAGTDTTGFFLTVGSAGANNPPAVNAGNDTTLKWYHTGSLNGKVIDDGLPVNFLSVRWRQLKGPAQAGISDSTQAATTVSFSCGGTYIFELTGFDGTLTSRDTVVFTVLQVAPIAVTYPATGTRLVIGSTVTIHWHMDESARYVINLLPDPMNSGDVTLLTGKATVGGAGDSTWDWYIDPALFTAHDSSLIQIVGYFGSPEVSSGFVSLVNGNPNQVYIPGATPEPSAVSVFGSGVPISLFTGTSGADIYYTLDGSTPTQSSSKYSAPIVISSPATIKASAYKSGMVASDIMTAVYNPTISKICYYPRTTYSQLMVGGIFEGTNDTTKGYKVLYTIAAQPPENRWTEVNASNFANPDQCYRFIRYQPPTGSYGAVSEIELYKGTIKCTGVPFGPPGSWAGSGTDFTKAWDGDITSYYAFATATGAYTGLDLGRTATPTRSPVAYNAPLSNRDFPQVKYLAGILSISAAQGMGSRIEVFNAKGAIVASVKCGAGKRVSLSVRKVGAGMLVTRIVRQDGQVRTLRFIAR